MELGVSLVMIFDSLTGDDFNNFCGDGEFPILKTMAIHLNGAIETPDESTPLIPINSTPTEENPCTGSNGHNVPHPTDCHKFYECTINEDGSYDSVEISCGELAFNPDLLICDWPINVSECN